MSILNIIDRRKRPYRFEKINAVVEPTRHDNRCKDADQAGGKDNWMGYDEREHISLADAIEWAGTTPDDLTLYIYDEDGGIYPSRRRPQKSGKSGEGFMSEMIDRVARALSGADGDPSVLFDYYTEHARAAIEAMREPTDEMLLAGSNQLDCPREKQCWQAMIDAALAKTPA